ncbi:MAG TPA: hypothetical protein VIM31_01335 [Candidatus Microsaccharimonas sp.]|jgi:hypothetical protein
MDENKTERLISPDVSEDVLRKILEHIKVNNRGEPLTWGATPLVMSPDVKMQQEAVKDVIAELFESSHIPSYVSESLAAYIDALNMSRTVNRESHNTESFIYRKKTDLDGIPFEALEVFDRALKGFASPAELLFIMRLLGIPTIELASLTHPYAQRITMLDDMRPAINEAITLMGGTLVKGINPVFEVKGSDNPHQPELMEGIHMTRKTLFGKLPDGTDVIERSSFVLLIDELPENIAHTIRSIPYENNPFWTNQIRRAGKLYEIAPLLLSGDKHDKAVPVSTTVVAINEALSEELLSKEAKRARRVQYLASHASKI